MKGIELAGKLFREFGEPMLASQFPELLPRLAIGIAGRGSECFGFDDDVSCDHDHSGGFTIWISEADDLKYGIALSRAYKELQKSFPQNQSASSALGGQEHGICVIDDFFYRHLGFPGAPRGWQEWLYTPEHAFAEVVNGEVFRDDCGKFSGIRKEISSAMPRDVRLKKLAARAVMMAQSGQYNFERCLRHNEPGAAAMALAEFVRHTVSMVFLLNHRFAPYYKWQFRAMRQLPWGSDIADDLENLLTGRFLPDTKKALISRISAKIISELAAQKLSAVQDDYLEPHAFALMSRIEHREIRALHIMEG
ncbi:MAG: DUF4037 domain-containing protein [Lentisphaerae bacterium]|nr:DUF4037 domain-containing protein [Lentisphaerota bacterium]